MNALLEQAQQLQQKILELGEVLDNDQELSAHTLNQLEHYAAQMEQSTDDLNEIQTLIDEIDKISELQNQNYAQSSQYTDVLSGEYEEEFSLEQLETLQEQVAFLQKHLENGKDADELAQLINVRLNRLQTTESQQELDALQKNAMLKK